MQIQPSRTKSRKAEGHDLTHVALNFYLTSGGKSL